MFSLMLRMELLKHFHYMNGLISIIVLWKNVVFYIFRYKFQPIQRYKALSAEEAEQEFSKRNKHLNYFSLMLRKRLRGDEDGEQEEGETGKPKKGGKSKGIFQYTFYNISNKLVL